MQEQDDVEPPYTIEDYFSCLPENLADDCASMSHFIGAGRQDFGLAGKALDDFIAESIKVVIVAGGWPVISVEEGDFWWWKPTDQWGGTAEEIAANLLAEWHKRGAPDLQWEGAYPFRPADYFGVPHRK
jgi:hypothetical protein